MSFPLITPAVTMISILLRKNNNQKTASAYFCHYMPVSCFHVHLPFFPSWWPGRTVFTSRYPTLPLAQEILCPASYPDYQFSSATLSPTSVSCPIILFPPAVSDLSIYRYVHIYTDMYVCTYIKMCVYSWPLNKAVISGPHTPTVKNMYIPQNFNTNKTNFDQKL